MGIKEKAGKSMKLSVKVNATLLKEFDDMATKADAAGFVVDLQSDVENILRQLIKDGERLLSQKAHGGAQGHAAS